MHDRPPGFEHYLSEDGWRRRWALRQRRVDRIKNGDPYQRVHLAALAPPDPLIDDIYASNRTFLLTYVRWRDAVYTLDRMLV